MVGFGCSSGGVGTSGFLGLLGTDASGALVQDRVHVLELGDTFDMLVGVVQIVITGMAKALVPEKALRSSLDGSKGGVFVDVIVEVNGMKCIWDFLHLGTEG